MIATIMIECSFKNKKSDDGFTPVGSDGRVFWSVNSGFSVTNEPEVKGSKSEVKGSKSKPEGSKNEFGDISFENTGQVNDSWCDNNSNFGAVENPIDFTPKPNFKGSKFTSYNNQDESEVNKF